MVEVQNDTIHLSRGDKAQIELTIDDYTFKSGDIIRFRVYRKNELNNPPLLDKEFTVDADSDSFDIILTSEDTKIGEMDNKRIEYWYEIELNGEQTILGFDRNGAKKLLLYPEGADSI